MMETGISWLAFFYLFVKPFRLWGADDPETVAAYDTTGLPPRWPMFFKTWREYENIHILFWLGKDVAWINLIPSMWVIFLVPTFGIAWDMVFVTFWKKHLMIDHAHNVTILIWVMANAIWAGDIALHNLSYTLFTLTFHQLIHTPHHSSLIRYVS